MLQLRSGCGLIFKERGQAFDAGGEAYGFAGKREEQPIARAFAETRNISELLHYPDTETKQNSELHECVRISDSVYALGRANFAAFEGSAEFEKNGSFFGIGKG